jgi:hypothetical protein
MAIARPRSNPDSEIDRDFLSIWKALTTYAEGLRTGKAALVREVFHPDALLWEQDSRALQSLSVDAFCRRLEEILAPAASGESFEYGIGDVEVIEGIATAIMLIEGLQDTDTVDHFHLAQVRGTWLIIGRTSCCRKRH